MSFDFIKGDERFQKAPDGFKVGDIILNTFKFGLEFKSVEPIKLSPKTEKKVIRKFKQLYPKDKNK